MSDLTHLLIVEDTEETAIFLSQILEDHGYPYQVARNGVEAISAVRESRPDREADQPPGADPPDPESLVLARG